MRKSINRRQQRQSMQVKQILKSRTRESINFKRQTRIFGFLLILIEIILCVMFGVFISYNPAAINHNDLLIPAGLSILTVVGIGLMNVYISGMKLSSMGFVLLAFAVSIQLSILVRLFWNMVGISSANTDFGFGSVKVPVLELVNTRNDRQFTDSLFSNSISDAMACGLSVIITMNAMIGRIGPLEILFLTVISVLLYQINNQLFWRLFITDCGYGMRVFLFGSVNGIIASLVLWKRDTTENHHAYSGSYFSRTYALVGSIIVWVLFPVLIVSDLYRIPTFGSQDNIVLTVAVLNTFLALFSSAISAFSASILMHNKISVHQVIHGIFAGGIVFSASADVSFNPGLPLSIGTITGFFTVVLMATFQRYINKKGILDTNCVVVTYLIPGITAGIVSAIVHATNPPAFGAYTANRDQNRGNFGQGGIQLAGIGIVMVIGIVAGLFSGLFIKIVNRNKRDHQFIDQSYFEIVEKEQ